MIDKYVELFVRAFIPLSDTQLRIIYIIENKIKTDFNCVSVVLTFGSVINIKSFIIVKVRENGLLYFYFLIWQCISNSILQCILSLFLQCSSNNITAFIVLMLKMLWRITCHYSNFASDDLFHRIWHLRFQPCSLRTMCKCHCNEWESVIKTKYKGWLRNVFVFKKAYYYTWHFSKFPSLRITWKQNVRD